MAGHVQVPHHSADVPPSSSHDEVEDEEPADCKDWATSHWDDEGSSTPMRHRDARRAMEMALTAANRETAVAEAEAG